MEPFHTPPHEPHYLPRASLLVPKGALPLLQADIWMGGAHSHVGEPFHAQELHSACVIECAGDLPAHYAPATRMWVPSVFIDVEGRPVSFERLLGVAARVAEAARGEGPNPVDRVYSICTYGMNRSGLMAGLVLRELGMPGAAAVALIQAKRPGSLSNISFRRIIADG